MLKIEFTLPVKLFKENDPKLIVRCILPLGFIKKSRGILFTIPIVG